MSNPKVSVIIPNYNHARYLSQRIESVIQQTIQDIEIILLDDCSPDASKDIIAQYAAQDNRIRVVLNEQNSGSTFKQWNKGVSLAQGKYIWIAESDDYSDIHFLERLLTILESDDGIGLAYCDSWSVDEKNKVIGDWSKFYDELDAIKWTRDFVEDGKHLLSKYMSFRNIIPNASAVLIRRSMLQHIGPADETFRINGDWIFWAKILAVSKIAFVSERLNYFRQHTNNVRSSTYINGVATLESIRVVLILSSLAKLEPYFYHKMLNILISRWIDGIIEDDIPLARHKQIYANLKLLNKQNIVQFKSQLANRLLSNRFNGLRSMVKNKAFRLLVKNKVRK